MSVKQQFTEEEIYKDRDSQISAIEKTFEDAQKSVSEHIMSIVQCFDVYQLNSNFNWMYKCQSTVLGIGGKFHNYIVCVNSAVVMVSAN